MSRSVGRDSPGASDEAVGVRPATRRVVRIDTHHCLFDSCQYEILCKGTEWKNKRCAESFHRLSFSMPSRSAL